MTRVDIEPITQVSQLKSGAPSNRDTITTTTANISNQNHSKDTQDQQDTLARSSESLSDISEEGTPRGGRVQGFFSRNAPERLSNLFRRSVDSADGKLRGLWRRGASIGSAGTPGSKEGSASASREGSISRGGSMSREDSVSMCREDNIRGESRSREGSISRGGNRSRESSACVSRSSSKDSVNLEAGVTEYLEGPTPPPLTLPPVSSSSSSSSTTEKTPEPEPPEIVPPYNIEGEGLHKNLLPPPPRSPNINIRSQGANYSPIPSSPRRTPVTENDPLGALSSPGDHTKGQSQQNPESGSSPSDPLQPQPDQTSLDGDGRGNRRASRRVARSATFTGRSGQDSPGHVPVQRSANSLWTLTPPPTHHLATTRPDSPDTIEDIPTTTSTALVASTSSWPLKLSFR